MHSTLALSAAKRPGQIFPGGSHKTERVFLDMVVGGKSLYELFKTKGDDLISVFWIGNDLPSTMNQEAIAAANRLMLVAPSDFPNNRRSLFVCPECADLGCGAISVVIEKGDGFWLWRDFGYENTYEDRVLTEDYADIGPFSFGAAEYIEVMNNVITTYSSHKLNA